MKKKSTPFKTNTFYYYANLYRQHLTDEAEIEKIDMTKVLEAEEEEMIKSGEIIKEMINAKMRLGKSTMAMARAYRIFGLLKKYKKKPKEAEFGINNIARDQQEYSKLMKNPELYNDVIVIDEGNALEETGENASAEQALRKVFSDVQAGRYVHNVYCSPKDMIDDNTDIMLSIISADHKRKITRSKLYYRYYEGGTLNIQLLGYVDTYVGDVIQEWDKIKEIVIKPKKTQQEQDKIDKAQAKDWYVNYMIRKYEKMELITVEGIFRPRLLEYAPQIKEVVTKLKIMCKLSYALNHDIIQNHIRIAFRKAKIPTSIIGEERATQEAHGLLAPYKTYYRLIKDQEMIEKSGKTDDDTEIKKEAIKEMLKVTLESITEQEKELNRYEEINRKYHQE